MRDFVTQCRKPADADAKAVDNGLQRDMVVIEALVAQVQVPVSVDTCKPEVMRAALAAGAGMVNDVQALRQPGALDAVADSNAAVVLMPHGLMDLARRARLRTLTWRYLGENVRANKL